jgi:hypothetical protein
MTTTRKKRPRKQTSQRVSSVASRMLRLVADARVLGFDHVLVSVEDIRALAGSALSQDERRGP